MELRSYAHLLQRRWLPVVLLPLATLVAVISFDQTRTTQYTATARVSLNRISPSVTSEDYEFDDYYDLLASDFILDDTVEVVRGNIFAKAVSERLASQGVNLGSEHIDNSLDSSREHRILTIRSTTSDSGLSVIVANVASAELRENFDQYIGVEDDPLPVTMRPVDVPLTAHSDTDRVRLVYMMAAIVAAGLGLIAAFILEYFDESLTADSAGNIVGLELLGVVPEESR